MCNVKSILYLGTKSSKTKGFLFSPLLRMVERNAKPHANAYIEPPPLQPDAPLTMGAFMQGIAVLRQMQHGGPTA